MKMKRSSVAVLTCVAALAACQTSSEVSSTIAVAKEHNLAGLQKLNKYNVVVRTYKLNADGKSTEVTGVSCTLQSAQLSASVVTPQNVRLPAFAPGARFKNGGKPGNMTVRCAASGLSGQAIVEPVNAFGGGGYSGVDYTTTRLDLGVSSSKPWVYPPISVNLQ